MFAVSFLCLAAAAAATSAVHGPFSSDFVNYLEKEPELNEYILSSYKRYGTNGTFGGKINEDDEIKHQPVVFVHGNSDSALYHSAVASGWSNSVQYFKENHYTFGEMYGLTYGTRDIGNAPKSSITCRNILGTRRLIIVTLDYTGAEKIDVIAHSMGVTLARKAIQGGRVELPSESCNLGESIADRVDTLVAISGANYGMCMCRLEGMDVTPACSQAGYSPSASGSYEECGAEDASSDGKKYASILQTVNDDAVDNKEADFIASLWGKKDIVLGYNNLAWGRKTSLVPGSDLSHAYSDFDHFKSKDDTVRDQFSLVSKHTLSGASRAKRHHRRH